jgi:DNA repair exonuclease SbcCD ATPase subunit
LLRQRLESEVANKKADLAAAREAIQNKDLQLNNAQSNIRSLESNIRTLQGNVAGLQSQLATSQDQASELQAQVNARQQELDRARELAGSTERKYLVLVGEHDDLRVRYDKLIKPARSSNGRHLVEVRYWKEDASYRISWREGNADPFQDITRKQLDLVLTRLSAEQENGLYIKVIFPENSGLSYNEAWSFTSHLHRNYDYYFKEESQ